MSGIRSTPLVERDGARTEVRSRRHQQTLEFLGRLGFPFLVGGGHALRHYTGDVRGTKDLDLFVRRGDALPILEGLASAGFETDLTFPHWLGKAEIDGDCIDVIYSSGNGVAEVDDEWFAHSQRALVLGVPVSVSPPEEMIWSKAFVMERERYDGADIAHLIRACRGRLDWDRLVARFATHWRVLLSHLTLFGFIYPGESDAIPPEVLLRLCRRLTCEIRQPSSKEQVCLGTLLSREQYLTDVGEWGLADGRLSPRGQMTCEDVKRWTAAIEKPNGCNGAEPEGEQRASGRRR